MSSKGKGFGPLNQSTLLHLCRNKCWGPRVSQGLAKEAGRALPLTTTHHFLRLLLVTASHVAQQWSQAGQDDHPPGEMFSVWDQDPSTLVLASMRPMAAKVILLEIDFKEQKQVSDDNYLFRFI